MATPLVAGCVASLREVLIKHGSPKPPTAFVKVFLINGADCRPDIPKKLKASAASTRRLVAHASNSQDTVLLAWS
ncbi:hypothetical protein T440DRAFT_470943 [Plenodomus tracheiphilus IPT5]|uniref:Uncharacterized protein n=1 Tax=Plenodomus tracheiphilus IPT5 TaxID=1408161 RepID=A0A6A7AX20_9PLEO|nr:hypothetical protein T440DRAFT_470943 [Plenodomus tracheiphilus IPT5]